MLISQSKKLGNQVKQLGLPNFVAIKITEQWYKLKLNALGVNYPSGRNDLTIVNHCSVNKDARFNDPSAYYVMIKGFAGTGLKYNDINLLDIGCGSGKVLNFGMLKKFKQVIGIDLDDSGIKKAEHNCLQMHNNGYESAFKIYCADACNYKIPAGTNVIFIANPFGKKTMETFFENIKQYYKEYRQELFIIYTVPVHKEVFEASPECKVIYQLFNRQDSKPEVVVFKIA